MLCRAMGKVMGTWLSVHLAGWVIPPTLIHFPIHSLNIHPLTLSLGPRDDEGADSRPWLNSTASPDPMAVLNLQP